MFSFHNSDGQNHIYSFSVVTHQRVKMHISYLDRAIRIIDWKQIELSNFTQYLHILPPTSLSKTCISSNGFMFTIEKKIKSDISKNCNFKQFVTFFLVTFSTPLAKVAFLLPPLKIACNNKIKKKEIFSYFSYECNLHGENHKV